MTTITTRAGKTSPLTIAEVDANFTNLNNDKLETSTKDASGGVAGLTGFALNLKNAAGTVTSFLAANPSATRTWTMPSASGTLATIADLPHGIITSITSVVGSGQFVSAIEPAPSGNAVAHLALIARNGGSIANYLPTTLKPLGLFSVCFGGGDNAVSGDYCFAAGDGNLISGGGFSCSLGSYNTISGPGGAVSFGYYNTLTGDGCTSFGTYNTVSGNSSVSLGSSNDISGYACIGFGIANNIQGSYDVALGTHATMLASYAVACGNGSGSNINKGIVDNQLYTTSGDSVQKSTITPLQVSVGNWGRYLSSNGIVNDQYDPEYVSVANTRYSLSPSSTAAFEILVVARSSNQTSFASWKVVGMVNVTSTGLTTLHGVVVTTISNTPAWVFTTANILAQSNMLGPNGTNTYGSIDINAPASSGVTTVSWGATIIATEVQL